MKNKQLAEMIKRLRKDRKKDQKDNDLAMTDINTTASAKGVTHDVAEAVLKEFLSRAMVTSHARVANKTPKGRISHTKQVDITKAGPGVKGRYRIGQMVSEEDPVGKTETKAKKNKNVINTTPEQDSAMIGTQ